MFLWKIDLESRCFGKFEIAPAVEGSQLPIADRLSLALRVLICFYGAKSSGSPGNLYSLI